MKRLLADCPELKQYPRDVLRAAVGLLGVYGEYAEKACRAIQNQRTVTNAKFLKGQIDYWKHVVAGYKWAVNAINQQLKAESDRGQSAAGKRVLAGRKESGAGRAKARRKGARRA